MSQPQTAAACSRRVTIATKQERMIDSALSRNHAPRDATPKTNWSAPDALRTAPATERTTFDGLGDAARHVVDLLQRGPMLKRDLRAVTGQNAASINRAIDRLSDAGIVIKGDDRKEIPVSLSPNANDKLSEFYETGNIAEHQARIKRRCDREAANFRARRTGQQREPMPDIVIPLADIEPMPEPVRTETATPPACEIPTITNTPAPEPVSAVNIASDDDRAPTPAPARPVAPANIIAAWLARLMDERETIEAGNPLWLIRRDVPDPSELMRVSQSIGLSVVENPNYYMIRA